MKPEDNIFRFLNFTVQQHDDEEVPSTTTFAFVVLAFLIDYYYL